MKIITNTDSRNAPKKELIKNLTIAFALYDIDRVMPFMDEAIRWTLAGAEPVEGRENFEAVLQEMSQNNTAELTIHSIITDGNEAAIHGEILMEDGKTYGFSDFYEFSSAKGEKVKSITSYVVPLK